MKACANAILEIDNKRSCWDTCKKSSGNNDVKKMNSNSESLIFAHKACFIAWKLEHKLLGTFSFIRSLVLFITSSHCDPVFFNWTTSSGATNFLTWFNSASSMLKKLKAKIKSIEFVTVSMQLSFCMIPTEGAVAKYEKYTKKVFWQRLNAYNQMKMDSGTKRKRNARTENCIDMDINTLVSNLCSCSNATL